MTNQTIILNASLELMKEGKLGGTGKFAKVEMEGGSIENIEIPEDIHTFAMWKSLGYSVKKGEHAIAKIAIWKHTGAKTNGDENDENADTPVDTGHMFMKVSAFFSASQVEKTDPEKEKKINDAISARKSRSASKNATAPATTTAPAPAENVPAAAAPAENAAENTAENTAENVPAAAAPTENTAENTDTLTAKINAKFDESHGELYIAKSTKQSINKIKAFLRMAQYEKRVEVFDDANGEILCNYSALICLRDKIEVPVNAENKIVGTRLTVKGTQINYQKLIKPEYFNVKFTLKSDEIREIAKSAKTPDEKEPAIKITTSHGEIGFNSRLLEITCDIIGGDTIQAMGPGLDRITPLYGMLLRGEHGWAFVMPIRLHCEHGECPTITVE